MLNILRIYFRKKAEVVRSTPPSGARGRLIEKTQRQSKAIMRLALV